MLVTAVAFLAGIVSVLTPCVLPLLPALLAVSSTGDRRRSIGLVLGIITSFSIGLVALTALLTAAGSVGDWLRWVAVALLVGIGLMFLVPAAKDRVEAWTSRAIARIRPGSVDTTTTGFGGGLVAGLALGVVWTPCAGPILAAVAVAAAQDELGVRSLGTLAAFVMGMGIPLTAITFGGRRAGVWLRTRLGGRRLDIATGTVLLVTAALIASGLDLQFNRWAAENTAFTTTVTADLEASALSSTTASSGETIDLSPAGLEANGYPEVDELTDLGPAPALAGLGPWFNTATGEPLSNDDLAGNVVLVDFWTYSCVNCLRTLPYLRAWQDAYADDGLVIVGAHAPEFAFESVPANVERAVDDLDVTWPVALDNDFTTWSAFHNRYWPAKYLIDRDGTLRYAHYGEGAYDRTEQHIRTLLGTAAAPTGETLAGDDVADEAPQGSLLAGAFTEGQTPETYLGYQRGKRFAGRLADDPATVLLADEQATYVGPAGLDRHFWTLAGEWTLEDERSVAGADADLWLHYYGRDVFLVIGDTDEARAASSEPAVVVSDDQGPGGTTVRHRIDSQRLFVLRDTDDAVDGLMHLTVPAGVAVYAFTFG